MWNPPRDVTVVAFANRLEWFCPPFNSSELPGDLKKWKASKSPRLTDAWAPKNADVFIENYFTLCEGYTRAKWRSQDAAAAAPVAAAEAKAEGEQQAVESPSYAFTFDADSAFNAPSNAQQRMQADFNAVLMFYLREVLSEDILARVIHLYNSEEEPKLISWSKMLKVIKANQPQQDGIELLVDLMSRKRSSGESLHVWCNRLSLIRLALDTEKVTIPESTWVKLFKRQTSRAEQSVSREMEAKTTFAEVKSVVDAIKVADLPVYDSNLCSAVTSKLPVFPQSSRPRHEKKEDAVDAGAAARDRRPAKTQITCSVCGFVFRADSSPHSGKCRR